MIRSAFGALCVVVCVAGLAGCKIVKNPDPAAGAVQGGGTDETRMATRAAEIWAPKVVPFIAANATDIAVIRAALTDGPDAAGAKFGFRPESEGSAWNFIGKGVGVVVASDLKARAAKLDLDTDADGVADVTVQLGPGIKGTALRDAMPFLVFTDFRDQIEFAKLARSLNDLAHAGIAVPLGDPTGKSFAFEGVFSIRAKGEPILLVPSLLVAQ